MRFTRVPYREDFDARGAHSWRRLEGDQRQIVWHESEKSKKVESRKKRKLEKSRNSKKVETRKKSKLVLANVIMFFAQNDPIKFETINTYTVGKSKSQ